MPLPVRGVLLPRRALALVLALPGLETLSSFWFLLSVNDVRVPNADGVCPMLMVSCIWQVNWFKPLIKLYLQTGDNDTKKWNMHTGHVIGLHIKVLDDHSNDEIMAFRRSMLDICQEAVRRRCVAPTLTPLSRVQSNTGVRLYACSCSFSQTASARSGNLTARLLLLTCAREDAFASTRACADVCCINTMTLTGGKVATGPCRITLIIQKLTRVNCRKGKKRRCSAREEKKGATGSFPFFW